MMLLWCLVGTLFLISVQTSPLPATNNSTPRVFNHDEIIDKIKEMENEISANKRTIADNTKTMAENARTIKDLRQRLGSHAQCTLEKKEVCGPCICKEDRRLRKKYFCDCSLLEPRRDCLEFYQEGLHVDGLYMIKQLNKTFQVYCDQTTDGGGWTVIQRRNGDPSVNFQRNWEEYKSGFGDLQHEFWLGNEYLHIMSLTGQCKGANDLRVEIERNDNNQRYYAKYDHFAVNSEFHKYRLSIGNYQGNAGNYLPYSNTMKFSTYDQDNDLWGDDNCARKQGKSGWWYRSCYSGTLPNARYLFYGDSTVGNYNSPPFYWGWYLKFMEIKIRRNKASDHCSA